MENSNRACNTPSGRGQSYGVNVGDGERTISAVAGGFVLLYGLSKLPFSTVAAAITGGALLYRGLTGHCSAYQALDISTACGLRNDERGEAGRRAPRHGVTEVSLAATGESPPIS